MKERQIAETKAGERFEGMAVTYQLEFVQCGKAKCRKWHGPYWYAYTRKDGRARSLYIGKEFRTLTQLKRAADADRAPRRGTPGGKHASRPGGARARKAR